MKKGLLIVFSGPSGVGKGTILKELQKDERLKLVYSVSMTTRKPREGEVDGVNYFFVTKKRFKEAIKNNELLEYAEYVRNYYGTPRFFVEEQRKKGNNVILEIEIQGAKQIIAKEKDRASQKLVQTSIPMPAIADQINVVTTHRLVATHTTYLRRNDTLNAIFARLDIDDSAAQRFIRQQALAQALVSPREGVYVQAKVSAD
ncbi:MAG: guanylate kinase, partial [Erysipelotrichaceae bacterium]|nr:guanylate kinase [Erysipelotrichaceae bacterium]